MKTIPCCATPAVSAKDAAGKTRIYVLDDHPLVRRGLAELIAGEPDLVVCGEGSDAARAFNEIMKLMPDVVILDLALHGQSGLSLIKSIRSLDPRIGIIVLSMHDEKIYGLRALKAGAQDYVMKGSPAETVTGAIRRTRAGALRAGASLPGQTGNGIQAGTTGGAPSPVDQLTDRELEIVDQIGRGGTTNELASRLHVSVKTVETHRAHIKAKLHLENGAQLVRFCVRWVEENEVHPPERPDAGPPLNGRSAAA